MNIGGVVDCFICCCGQKILFDFGPSWTCHCPGAFLFPLNTWKSFHFIFFLSFQVPFQMWSPQTLSSRTPQNAMFASRWRQQRRADTACGQIVESSMRAPQSMSQVAFWRIIRFIKRYVLFLLTCTSVLPISWYLFITNGYSLTPLLHIPALVATISSDWQFFWLTVREMM